MKKTNLAVVRLGLAVAICAAAGAASAQPLVKGTFTLPYEVHWGKAVLPPGHYSIAIDRADRPALVTTPTGKVLAYVMARSFDDAMTGQPTALMITKAETQRFVRSFNWREGNRRFIYRAFTETERKQLGGATDVEAVAVAAGAFDFSGGARPESVRTPADVVDWYSERFAKATDRLKQITGDQLIKIIFNAARAGRYTSLPNSNTAACSVPSPSL